MVNLTLEEIVKWALAIMVIGTVFYLIFIHFNPTASDMFWGKINNATGIFKFGKEKTDYEFKMPLYMVNNVKTINETISILKDKNIPVEAISGEIIEQSLKLEDFRGCELTVRQDYNGKLKMMVKNEEGQIKYYKTKIPYSPCIIDLGDVKEFTNDYARKNDNEKKVVLKSKSIELVDKIVFINKNTFKIYDDKRDEDMYNGKIDYRYLEILIIRDNNVCFIGYQI